MEYPGYQSYFLACDGKLCRVGIKSLWQPGDDRKETAIPNISDVSTVACVSRVSRGKGQDSSENGMEQTPLPLPRLKSLKYPLPQPLRGAWCTDSYPIIIYFNNFYILLLCTRLKKKIVPVKAWLLLVLLFATSTGNINVNTNKKEPNF